MIPTPLEITPPCAVPGCDDAVSYRSRYCDPHRRNRPVETCDECGTVLREPAELCIFCEVELGMRTAV
jgi:hypothetical protein